MSVVIFPWSAQTAADLRTAREPKVFTTPSAQKTCCSLLNGEAQSGFEKQARGQHDHCHPSKRAPQIREKEQL